MEQTQQTTVETQGVDTEKIFHTVRMEVIESYPSIYSKDDVILLIDRLQKEIGTVIPKVSTESIEELQKKVSWEVIDIIENYDYDSDTEIDLDGREIRVDIDIRHLAKEVSDKITEIFDDHTSN